MKQSDMNNAPWLGGLIIAAAAGVVAAGATYVVGGFDLRQATFVGVAVFVAVGLFMGMPWSSGSKADLAAALPVAKSSASLVPTPPPPLQAPIAAPPMPQPAVAEATMPTPVVMAAEPVVSSPVTPLPAAVSGPAAMFTSAPAAAAPAANPVAKAAATPKAKATKSPVKPTVKAVPKPAVAKVPKPKTPVGLVRLTAPRKGVADDLKEIEGIGPALEKLCHSLGFYHFDQIAGWSDADVAMVDAEMKTFKGRIARDKWVAQSKIIVAEGLDAFRIRAKTNNY